MVRRKKPTKKTRKTGPTPIYKYHIEKVTELAKLGATQKQVALFFDVSVKTVEYWNRNYEDFKEAWKAGAIEADMRVAVSLYRAALGYDYEEAEYTQVTDPETGQPKMVLKRLMKKHVPPSVQAAYKWLNVRQREIWSTPELSHHHIHSGKIDHRHIEDIPVDELSREAQELAFEIIQKQLSVEDGSRDN